jgi:hypothetical protein
MPFMLLLALRIEQDVINKNHDKPVQLYHEYVTSPPLTRTISHNQDLYGVSLPK